MQKEKNRNNSVNKKKIRQVTVLTKTREMENC